MVVMVQLTITMMRQMMVRLTIVRLTMRLTMA
jgi:hypothetical protein